MSDIATLVQGTGLPQIEVRKTQRQGKVNKVTRETIIQRNLKGEDIVVPQTYEAKGETVTKETEEIKKHPKPYTYNYKGKPKEYIEEESLINIIS